MASISTFTILWTIVDFTDSYLNKSGIKNWEPPSWILLVCISIIVAIFKSYPRLKRTIKLGSNTDITITIKVGNMFKVKNSTVIIPMNSCFKHDHVPSSSIQVQYREQFFSNGNHFTREINNKIKDMPSYPTVIKGTTVKSYEIGTTIKLGSENTNNKPSYLITTTKLNKEGRAIPDTSDLLIAYNSLWNYIAENGDRSPLVTAVIGSGKSNTNRVELIHLLVNSFIESIKTHNIKFTESLTICISPKSFATHEYSLDELEQYIQHVCKYR
ncbi:hypothetical protein D3C74_224410 [compost metagenome]